MPIVVHEFAINEGITVPLLMGWLRAGTVLKKTIVLDGRHKFALFYAHDQDSYPRQRDVHRRVQIGRVRQEWFGEMALFRLSVVGKRFVNLRAGDEALVWFAIKQ